jgi:hypothetical protein
MAVGLPIVSGRPQMGRPNFTLFVSGCEPLAAISPEKAKRV